MNNLVGNFTGMDGRINRQAWWIGAVVLIIAQIIVAWIVGLIIPGGGMTFGAAMDPAAMSRAGWQGLVIGILFAYPWLAISVKRRKDRNNNGYDAIGFIVLLLVYYLSLALTALSTITMVISVVFLIYAIYMLVQLGFLKGTAGPNNYGPDPLGG